MNYKSFGATSRWVRRPRINIERIGGSFKDSRPCCNHKGIRLHVPNKLQNNHLRGVPICHANA